MLLRVILSQDDIRRITIDSMPETVDGLHLMLKNKLGLEGDLVVQFQDPEFDNELCNLSSMSELPKDKVTLKVYSKNLESYHTDSTLDTASLSTSAEGSPSASHTRQLPQPFDIPTFSYDVELKLKKGNEAFHEDGTLLDVSKDTKSDILDKIAEAIYVHNAYPTREDYDLMSQALVDKHPCLREPGSVSGWYCWKFSLKFKMGNFRQKLRLAGCPELNINSRSSGTPGKGKLKRARKSEVNFLPDIPEGKTQRSLEEERTEMVTEMKKRKIDWQKIKGLMTSTFSLRRKTIVEDEPPVADVRERWPALFSERQIEAEFARLTSVDLKDSLFAGLDKYLLRFLGVYRARMGLVELNSLLRTLDIDGSNQRQRAVVLMGLPHYLKDGSTLYKKVQVTDAEEDWTKGMAVGILMVAQIDELVRFAVVLEEEIIFPSLSDFPTAVALLMGLLFALNIDYPRGLRYTFEVIQKVLMDIGGGQCSALVHGLKNRLLRKKM
ncbi:uncharacterized protein LOC134019259 [Osmerus eperlanus]|uniref:uncharacterized protein LOC134019259 n=1 Tax=Osmerus eperlanus TaxID=29151 RepID=UPI002E0EEFF7